jgi:biofilm protein TabA
MILDHLDNAARYSALNEGLSAGFGFLAQPNIEQLESGRYEIAGDRVYAIVDRTEGRRMDDALLESHRKYVDIQFIIAGSESIGWSPRKGLTTAVEYDAERDLEFHHGKPASLFLVPPGSFAIFLPTDAHMPLIGEGPIHKVVVKVAVD